MATKQAAPTVTRRLGTFDEDMLSMIRRYKRVVSAARLFVLSDTFAPHKKAEAKQQLIKALDNVRRVGARMRVLTDEQIDLLIYGIESGMSRSQLAKYAGVSERTAVSYRDHAEAAELAIPENCGCGRPIRHMGRCTYRRTSRTVSSGLLRYIDMLSNKKPKSEPEGARMVKRNTEPIDQTCPRCGGLHFGSYRCPYLDTAVCFACLKTIAAEPGSDPHVHPNRKYDAIGRVYHDGCPLSEIDYSCCVDAASPGSATIGDAIRLIEKMEKCDGMPAKLILLRNFILFVAGRLSDWP